MEASEFITYTLGEGATWKDGLTNDKISYSPSLQTDVEVVASVDKDTKRILTLTFFDKVLLCKPKYLIHSILMQI